MLCKNNYRKEYINECRSKMESQLAAYKNLVAAATRNGATGKTALNSALNSFEVLFFNNLIVVLDGFFVHRSRTIEKKDGNPLNEVRLMCNSILQNRGVLTADKTIKYNPAKSILKLQIGDGIKLNEPDFVRLFRAFFTEIETKFLERKG